MNIRIPTPTLVDISKLRPYTKNAKQHDATQIANVAESIRQFGFVQPFVIDADNSVVIGHCRLLAAQQLGIKELPCVRVDYLTQKQVKALRILDNKLNESAWDFDLLKDEIAEIDLSGFEIDFDLPDDILDDNAAQEDDYEIPADVEPRVHFGEVWQLGRHRLMCGDSTDLASVEKLIGGGMSIWYLLTRLIMFHLMVEVVNLMLLKMIICRKPNLKNLSTKQ